MRTGHSALLSTLAAVMVMTGPAAARSAYDEAVDSYKAGRYASSVKQLESLLLGDPTNQMARYYLACSLAKSGDHVKAGEQFRLAYLLDPRGSVAGYCKQAMTGYKMALPTSETLVVKSNPGNEREASGGELETTCEKIRQQAGFARDKYRLTAQDKERRLKSSLDERLRAIDDQMQIDIARLNDPIVYNPGPRANPLLYLPEILKEREDLIRRQAKEQKELLMKEAQDKQDGVSGAQKARESVLDEVATNLESQLTARTGRHGVKLRAKGTSLYVRNYEPNKNTSAPDVRPAVVRLVNAQDKPEEKSENANFVMQ